MSVTFDFVDPENAVKDAVHQNNEQDDHDDVFIFVLASKLSYLITHFLNFKLILKSSSSWLNLIFIV